MQELVLLSTTLLFLSLGVISPFIMSLGYIWVDCLLPHRLSYSILASMPIAFIFGAGSVAIYLIKDRRFTPRISAVHIMCGVIALWITLTTTWAVVPADAWGKWDSSFKTVVFVIFIPFVFRTRVHIEAFCLVFAFSAAGHLIPWGLKTMLTGGGYELSLGLMGVNSTMLAESSTVAAVTIMFIPMLLWMRKYSLLIPWPKARLALASFLIPLYVIANIGTFARTGLVAFGVAGVGMLLRTKRKALYLVLAACLGGVAFYFASDRWAARISTVSDFETEASALIRIRVWQWTLNFATTHPFGGGFNAYVINVISLGNDLTGEPRLLRGRAFHNIYMAALGEHGYPGLALYVCVLGLTLLSLQRVIRRSNKRPDLEWAAELARALQVGLLILMACGNFVDISFSFLVWDMIAIGLCLSAHVEQVLSPKVSLAERVSQKSSLVIEDIGPRPLPGMASAMPRNTVRSRSP